MNIQKSKTMRRKLSLLLACLSLLCGCAKEPQAEGSTPASVSPEPPAQTESTPSPAPADDTPASASPEPPAPAESTPSPTPEEPSPTPAETAPTPEELLAQQPIDESHDAFLVNTGGELGTVLVTLETSEGTSPEGFSNLLLSFSVWGGSDLTQPIQAFEETGYMFIRDHDLIDLNFDGHMDFTYGVDHGATNGTFALYIWDEEQGQFASKGQIFGSGPMVHEETKTIVNYQHASAFSGGDEVYRWEDGELVRVRLVVEEDPGAERERQDLVVYEMVDGELKEIFRKTFAFDPEGAEHPIYDEAALWYDLSYYGES